MTIQRAIIHYPRPQVTQRWIKKEELLLSTVGLRVVGGIYRKSSVTLYAAKAKVRRA